MLDSLRHATELLLLPPALLLISLGFGVVLLFVRRRLGIGVIMVSTGALFLLSMPMFASALTRALGVFEPLSFSRAASAQAIVILSAEQRYSVEYHAPTLGDMTLDRLRYGVHVARMTGLPILVSGGHSSFDRSSAPVADLMQAELKSAYELPARWVENASETTEQNAARSKPILTGAGVHTIVLVTHYAHMARAKRDFEAQGFEVIPAPVRIPLQYSPTWSSAWIPTNAAMETSRIAFYEFYSDFGHSLGILH